MAEIVRMPKLSDTMTEGVVAEWHKKVGDQVEEGDLLADIETDKATMEFESFQDGTLLYIGVEKGQTAPVDSILCVLGEEGEDFQSLIDGDAAAHAAPAEEAPQEAAAPAPAPAPEAPKAAPAAAPVAPAPAAQSGSTQLKPVDPLGSDVKASPLARKMAEDKGIDIRRIVGTGDGGRVVKYDIENYTPGVDAPAAAVSAAPVGVESYRDEPVSQMRKVIASRLAESKFSAPHFYVTMEIDMDNVMAARKGINDTGLYKVSFNDFVIKATAAALKKHPAVNASWRGDFIRYNEHVNIGVAVAVPDGLLVPVVRFADSKSLSAISAEVKDYAVRAKDKKLAPNEWEGNTFTISNMGMFGVEEFTAIINPPDACILAIGGIVEKPVVKNGQIVIGHTMKVTLSSDHRVVDGATASEFLNTFKAMMENPVLIMA